MYFSNDEIKIVEDLAWKMLDGFNHAYLPNLSDYAYFYYNGELVLDPWMKEDMQGIPWPDHESDDTRVDPVKYYGEKVIEAYIARLFLIHPDWYPEITEKINNDINKKGVLIDAIEAITEIDYDALHDEGYTDLNILNMLSEKYPYLSPMELQLMEQLNIEYDAEYGYDYYDD